MRLVEIDCSGHQESKEKAHKDESYGRPAQSAQRVFGSVKIWWASSLFSGRMGNNRYLLSWIRLLFLSLCKRVILWRFFMRVLSSWKGAWLRSSLSYLTKPFAISFTHWVSFKSVIEISANYFIWLRICYEVLTVIGSRCVMSIARCHLMLFFWTGGRSFALICYKYGWQITYIGSVGESHKRIWRYGKMYTMACIVLLFIQHPNISIKLY